MLVSLYNKIEAQQPLLASLDFLNNQAPLHSQQKINT